MMGRRLTQASWKSDSLNLVLYLAVGFGLCHYIESMPDPRKDGKL